ncbi:type VII secretion target [Micromonospora krabiensis]|nr:type VII secretion target [Micromonospora krabiensis]
MERGHGMIDKPLGVEPEALLATARAMDGDAVRLAHGLAGVPGLAVAAPGWRAGNALAALESAVHGWLGRLGARVAGTAAAVRAAAQAYEAVDERAAGRLTGLPR